MKIRAALGGVRRLYVEAAPFIYYVEEHPTYIDRMDEIIGLIEDEPIEGISSVITLTEVLNQPMRLGRLDLEREYQDILLNSGFRLERVNAWTAESAARLRARYNLRTPDAIHMATALETSCDAFLTNDNGIKRVTEIKILVLDDLETD